MKEEIAECSTDVLVSFAESLHVYPGLLTVATVFGGLSGILAAALLYVFCLKPLLLTRQVSAQLQSVHPLNHFNSLSSTICSHAFFMRPFRDTMQGGCLNLMMVKLTTTKVTVSATAGRKLQVAPLMKRYLQHQNTVWKLL